VALEERQGASGDFGGAARGRGRGVAARDGVKFRVAHFDVTVRARSFLVASPSAVRRAMRFDLAAYLLGSRDLRA